MMHAIKPEEGYINSDGRLRVSALNREGKPAELPSGMTSITLILDVALSPPRDDEPAASTDAPGPAATAVAASAESVAPAVVSAAAPAL